MKKSPFYIKVLVVAVFLFHGASNPIQAAEISVTDLAQYTIIKASKEKLLAEPYSCVEVTNYGTDTNQLVNPPDDKPLWVVTPDSPAYVGPGTYSYLFCSGVAVEQAKAAFGTEEPPKEVSGYESFFAGIVAWIIHLVALIGVWLLDIASFLLGAVISASRFITNPIVRSGWPFVQGIANLGFILALLLIAALTTLRVDIGGGVRRLLPRLLIAALLINFSLVIAGLLIDSSRVLMAVMVSIMQPSAEDCGLVLQNGQKIRDPRISDIGGCLLKASKFDRNVYQLGTDKNGWTTLNFTANQQSWAVVLQVAKTTILIWALLSAFIVIAALMVVRYIMLILLLIVSPLAYLAIALPGTGNFAELWWRTFLKYVYYGPLALFMLLIIVKVGQGTDMLAGLNIAEDNREITQTLQDLIQTIIVIALTIAAATLGKHFGMVGSSATVNFIKGMPGRAARHPKTTAAVLGGIATGGAGGLLGIMAGAGAGALGAKGVGASGRYIKRVAKDFGKSAAPTAREIAKRTIGVPAKRDDKDNLKPGQTSLGTRIASKLVDPLNPKKNEERATVRDAWNTNVQPNSGNPAWLTANLPNIRDLSPTILAKPHILFELGDQKVNMIVQYGSQRQRMAILKEKYYINSLNDDQVSALEQAIEQSAPPGGDRDKSSAADQLLKTLGEG